MALQASSPLFKDWVDLVTLIGGVVAVIGGLIAAFKTIQELQQSRRQRDEELRWKQANVAKQLLDELFGHEYSENAVLMLDWNKSKREYVVGDESLIISYEDVLTALTKEQSDSLSEKEIYIRECFDFFFYFIDRIKHYININLTNFEDIKAPLKPYAKKINSHREIYYSFMQAQEYEYAEKLIKQLSNGNKSIL
jgi:hypothetical protein